MKQFIYASRCKQQVPMYMEFMNKLSNWFLIERQIMYDSVDNILLVKSKKKAKKFYNKWANMF